MNSKDLLHSCLNYVERIEQVNKIQVLRLKQEDKYLKKFLQWCSSLLDKKKEVKVFYQPYFETKIEEYYKTTFNQKKDLVYNTHFKDFKNNAYNKVENYKIYFTDQTTIHMIVVPHSKIAQLV